MKNYNEYTAPEGYYYHKGDIYAKTMCLPLSIDINDFELVTEEVYKKHLAEQKAKMEEERKKAQEQINK